MNYIQPEFIAELCCNHMGSVSLAKDMILQAKKAGATAIKLQKRNIEVWAKKKPDVYNKPHPHPENSFGKTYKEHRQKLELSVNDHKELRDYCSYLNIKYGVSVFDINSAVEMVELNPDFVKIPSACNMQLDLIEWICRNYKGEIHISLGMTKKNEIKKIMAIIEKNNRLKDLCLYICTSGYPVDYRDICLLEISDLVEKYGNKIKKVGFSGHHIGIAPDIAAYVLGATVFERHFTVNKELKGTDQKFALTEEELSDLVNSITNVRLALRYKPNHILDVEKSNREKLKW